MTYLRYTKATVHIRMMRFRCDLPEVDEGDCTYKDDEAHGDRYEESDLRHVLIIHRIRQV